MWFEQASLPGRPPQASFTVRSSLCKARATFKISALLAPQLLELVYFTHSLLAPLFFHAVSPACALKNH